MVYKRVLGVPVIDQSGFKCLIDLIAAAVDGRYLI